MSESYQPPPHPNGWSEDLAWNRNKPLSPAWAHWYRLMLSMHHDRYATGTINELR